MDYMQNNRRLLFLFTLVTLFQPIHPCYGKTSIDYGIGRMEGHTTYSIGGYYKKKQGTSVVSGYYNDPLSRLEFFLNVNMVQLGIEHYFDSGWVISADYSKNISYKTDKMKDSD